MLVKRTKVGEEEMEVPGEGVMEAKCDTPWTNLDKGEIVAIRVTCQSYQPVHPQDSSCHTNLAISAQSIVAHMAPDHGASGGFYFQLRHRPGQKTSLWKDLFETGVELHDFRCDVCNEQLPLAPRRIIKHMAAHAGKSRSPKAGGLFQATLRFGKMDDTETEEGYE